MTVPFDLDGAVGVVTGAGSGVGRATALSLVARGARVAVSDIDLARAEETASLVEAEGGEAIAVRVDVAKQDELEEVRDRCLERFGRIEVVVNNVGVVAMGAPESLPLEAWRRAMDLNLMSVARSNLVFLPLLLGQRRGHVVNTASVHGLLATGFDRLPYVASKHAMVAVSEALAIYLGPRGIGVTCACPSRVTSNIAEQITTYGEVASPRPLGHPIAEPGAVGELIVDAVTAGTFLVVTAPEVRDELRERASDPEAYIQRLIREQQP
ncbi:MAG TPA: SDR family NAD(P)-dependent oxidoreductase [Solirubrobacteraceae bacterium]|nr:SDR family NAD(P)-dependent oxidoreductase [Solirubrobacteraceae bacterium]